MKPEESKRRAQAIIEDFATQERKKLAPPDPVTLIITRAQQVARDTATDFAHSLALRPLRPTKKEATDIMYDMFRSRFKSFTKDELEVVCSWMHACLVAERMRDYLV